MNAPLLIAAATLFSIGTMHTVLAEWRGDRRLVRRIVQSTLFDTGDAQDVLARQVVRLAWHLTSLAWCGIAAVLATFAFAEQTWVVVATSRILSAVFFFHAALSLMLARGRHPSWYLFLIVSALAFLGTVSGG